MTSEEDEEEGTAAAAPSEALENLAYWYTMSMTGKDATGALARQKAWWWFCGKKFMPGSGVTEGAEASGLQAGSDTTVCALSSMSLCWWDSLSGSSTEETAAKAATAMAERGRWREAILPPLRIQILTMGLTMRMSWCLLSICP
jgi:hypothetical protein